MKIGVNSVLFKGFDAKTAFKAIKLAGYDGAELSCMTRAIMPMLSRPVTVITAFIGLCSRFH